MTGWSFGRCLAAASRVLVLWCVVAAAHAATTVPDAQLSTLVDALGSGDFDRTSNAVKSLAATGDDRSVAILNRLAEGGLYVVNASGAVVSAERDGERYRTSNPVTGQVLSSVDASLLTHIKVNNRLRREIGAAVGSLTLMTGDRMQRHKAVEAILKTRDVASIPLLERAIAAEREPELRLLMLRAKAAVVLGSTRPDAEKLVAIRSIAANGDREALALLVAAGAGEGPVGEAARAAVVEVERKVAFWSAVQNVVYGLSLGSVLLLAAIGLSITFGVMGIINMAHGEMVMLGAYSTYAVQTLIRAYAPTLFDYSLLIALPVAFAVSAIVGIAIERSLIRWLYGRPLETLLATWGVSLILQQTVRTLFGASNREVGNPSWMSGSFELGMLTITWSRLWIILFALSVFLLLLAFMGRTFSGLQMRAVTQHRPMASAMGIRTPLVDALTFGLGCGIAGIAGVALSQIDNVSPNLGRGYIIDSFMVVVFGGVGNLWGTLIASAALGVVTKLLEPFAGAVLGKIFVLVFIVLFIQKRPRGLFALRGRAAEA